MAAFGGSAGPFGRDLWASIAESARRISCTRSPTGRMFVRLGNLVLYVVAGLAFYAGVTLWLMVQAGVLE